MPRKRARETRFFEPRPADSVAGVVLIPELLGIILREHRTRAQVRQTELAQALDWPQSVISRVERGDVNLSVEQLDALVGAVGNELVQRGEDPVATRDVLQDVDRRSRDLVDLGYELAWSTGVAWDDPRPLVRGKVLLELLDLTFVPFAP